MSNAVSNFAECFFLPGTSADQRTRGSSLDVTAINFFRSGARMRRFKERVPRVIALKLVAQTIQGSRPLNDKFTREEDVRFERSDSISVASSISAV